MAITDLPKRPETIDDLKKEECGYPVPFHSTLELPLQKYFDFYPPKVTARLRDLVEALEECADELYKPYHEYETWVPSVVPAPHPVLQAAYLKDAQKLWDAYHEADEDDEADAEAEAGGSDD